MKKPSFPLWIIALLVLLIGGLVAISSSTNRNIQPAVEHDHDHDGKADHAEGEHH
jgi:hypothetical protein